MKMNRIITIKRIWLRNKLPPENCRSLQRIKGAVAFFRPVITHSEGGPKLTFDSGHWPQYMEARNIEKKWRFLAWIIKAGTFTLIRVVFRSWGVLQTHNIGGEDNYPKAKNINYRLSYLISNKYSILWQEVLPDLSGYVIPEYWQ